MPERACGEFGGNSQPVFQPVVGPVLYVFVSARNYKLLKVEVPERLTSGVSATGNLVPGGVIKMTDTVSNSVGVVPASTTWFYLSTNQKCSTTSAVSMSPIKRDAREVGKNRYEHC
jgi:hypothetical protein